ncbi:type IV pilus assembly protein PilM [Alkaliphilus sp. B6464]|uniref:type IV pilus assembly protein PilM n=1 Tax=Alkaliphilus sp. B6464 TaxID=2731219 RepID=UPI001BA8B258|nr:type IV pilus assembly protein PilM [Alkaliphilus sp. B6464]QUH20677.1 type IV pilus assembly protein PilM [Alkaliphilus sp. B6464]
MFNKNVISIDIGAYTTKLVVGSYRGNKVDILHIDSLNTPSNSINDGQVIDLNKVKSAIKECINNMKIKPKKVIFTLDSTAIITRELSLPCVKNEELEQILLFEVQQHFPTDLSEYVIQSKKLEDFEEDGVKKSKIVVAALPKVIVKTYLELANALELEPIALDVHFNGIAKLFENNFNINSQPKNQDQTIAIIDLGYDNINVNIIDKNISRFNRLLTIGGKEIDLNIANNFNFSLEEAQRIKLEQSTFKDDSTSSLYIAIEEVISGCIDNWLDEIQRIFKFYTSRSPENKISKIYLYGGHANLKNITKYFELFFDIPTESIDDISYIYIKNNDIKNISITTFLNAIGAIIRK